MSSKRSVPNHIAKPDYARTGKPGNKRSPLVTPPDVIERMRVAGRLAAEVLKLAGQAVQPGITTDHLDDVVYEACIARNAYPSPLNYQGFPKSVCTSVNEVVCHGIPGPQHLNEGDIVNIDVTLFINGVHGDTNATFFVGEVSGASKRLVQVTKECLDLGIDAVKPGRPISDIGRAIESHAGRFSYGVVRMFVGHGIGEIFHTDLQIPHYFDLSTNTEMQPGMTFTIEPMVNAGGWQARVLNDGWTAVTVDGTRSAQFEHTLVVTETGPDILTEVA